MLERSVTGSAGRQPASFMARENIAGQTDKGQIDRIARNTPGGGGDHRQAGEILFPLMVPPQRRQRDIGNEHVNHHGKDGQRGGAPNSGSGRLRGVWHGKNADGTPASPRIKGATPD